jgi:LysM repeat protein
MKFQYRPYRERSAGSRWTQYSLLVLAILIVGLVVLNRYRGKQESSIEPVEAVVTTQNTTAENAAPAPVSKTTETIPTAASAGIQQPVVKQVKPVEPNQAVLPDPTSSEAAAIIKQAVQDMNEGRIIPARDQLNRVLDMKLSDAVRDEVKKQLTKLAQTWLFSKTVSPGDALTELHKVQPGEVLAIFARQYKTPHECIEKINGIINPERLQAGQAIKIVHGPFSIVISKKNFTLDLYLQGMFVKQYKVGLGRVEHETPAGKWRVAMGGKLVTPTWTDPDTGRVYHGNDPDYPLGSRWIGLEGLEGLAKGRTGFAIHGTKDPETIGTRASRGCIRLFNGDAVEVYDLMEPGVSEVEVVE